MKISVLQAAMAAGLALAAPSQAAVLSFDLSGLEDAFGVVAPVSGGFTYDTVTETFGGVDIATDLDGYASSRASVFDGTGFGLPALVFLFRTPMTTLFFGLDGLDAAAQGLGVGDMQDFSDTFGFESDEVTADFQIGLNGRFAVYFGPVTVTRLADQVPTVPLPATLPLLLLAMGALYYRPRRS